ncbi:MAG: pre-peptidase C-terminal domain-containing protein [Chloroflexia bacterium]
MPRNFIRPQSTRTGLARPALIFLLLLSALPITGSASARLFSSENSLARNIQTSPNGLVINEIFYSQTVADQYFELFNTGPTAINLSTYQIYNRDGSNNLSNLSDLVINPGQFRVIGPTQLGTPTIAGSGLARTDFLGIVNTSPTDTVIDVVNFGGSPNPNWANYERFSSYFFTANVPQLPVESTSNTKSLQRWPDGQESDQGTDFAQIFSSPSAPSCADPYENDNTSSEAVNQAVGATVLHRLCAAGDQDWVAVSMTSSFTYTVSTAAQGSLVDTVLRLYDSSNTLIVEDDNSTSRSSTISFRPTSSGSFRVQVTQKNGAGNSGPNFLYTLSITATSSNTPTPTTPTPAGCQDAYEPDNGLTTARGIELNSEQTHVLCPAGDQDWVVFAATANKIYTMYTKDLALPVDTLITLYDSRGNRLAENDDFAPGQGLESQINYSFSSAGTYYLRIRDARGGGGTGYSYTVGVSSEGALPPTVTTTRTPTINPNATATSGPCYDQYEPDGVPETARAILIGATQRHSICPAVDADWVRFYARAGKVYTVRTSNLGIGLDTYMYIFDTDGRGILAQNDDGGEGVASRIDFYPVRDDWYYVQVKNAGDIGGSDQTYELALIVAPGAPQPPSTATAGGPPPSQATGTVVRQPTTVVQPTTPPQSTPTQGIVPPTPAAARPTLPLPVGTAASEVTKVPTVASTTVATPPAQPTSGASEPTVFVPGVPITGARSPEEVQAQKKEQVAAPAPPKAPITQAPMLFRVYYDRNGTDTYDVGEGIRGLEILFLSRDAGLGLTGSMKTSDTGTGKLTLPVMDQQVYIPYLGINVALTKFPERELHSLWLPAVQLPERVP